MLYSTLWSGKDRKLHMINKEYKDRLFKAIFGSREHRDWTLALYNAVNGSGYDDPSKIEFNTIENAVYLGMHNGEVSGGHRTGTY